MALKDKRILVVEDDAVVGEAICADLRDAGAIVLGPAPTSFYAQQLLGRRAVDAAVLDIKLHGQFVYDLADDLVRRGTPFVFVTGTEKSSLPERFQSAPHFVKPHGAEDLLQTVEELFVERRLTPVAVVTKPVATTMREPAPPRAGHGRLMQAISAGLKTRH